MINGEAQSEGPQSEGPQSEGPQPQRPAPPPAGEASSPVGEAITPDSQQAQSEFINIKRALTERRANPDPEPGWILPRVDDRAAFSEPTLNRPNPDQ